MQKFHLVITSLLFFQSGGGMSLAGACGVQALLPLQAHVMELATLPNGRGVTTNTIMTSHSSTARSFLRSKLVMSGGQQLIPMQVLGRGTDILIYNAEHAEQVSDLVSDFRSLP